MSSPSREPRDEFAHVLLLSPFYILYALWRLLVGVVRLPDRARGARAAMRDVIFCPNGHDNAAIGRFECAACHGTYHGWVGACELCGAGAGWIACERCGVSIRLPWEPR